MKLAPEDYQQVLQLGKTYFENRPKVTQKTTADQTAIKLATVRAKQGDNEISAQDLSKYHDQGNKISTPGETARFSTMH